MKRNEKIYYDMFWASVEGFEDCGMSEYAAIHAACEMYKTNGDYPTKEKSYVWGVLP